MKIESLILGDYQTNCYILRSEPATKQCLIIDTGLEAEVLIDFLQGDKLNPAVVVLTHGHADHISGITLLRKNYPEIKVYIHKLDAEMLTDARSNLSALAGKAFDDAKPADVLLEEAEVIELAGITLGVLHTPGHTPGGICLYSKENNIVFVGDTLFAQSVGRTDFPGGSMPQLIAGIKEKLCTLPDDTIVYPGHGPQTTIGLEKSSNPYLQ